MPDAVDPLGSEQVIRLLAQGCGHRWSGVLRWTYWFGLSQHPLHGGAANQDAGAKHLPRHRARAELWFWAKPSEFVGRPTNRLVDAVPDHGSIQ